MKTSKHFFNTNVDFEPAVYIYLEKYAEEQGLTTNAALNKLIREKALEEFKEPERPDYNPWRTIDTTSYPDRFIGGFSTTSQDTIVQKGNNYNKK